MTQTTTQTGTTPPTDNTSTEGSGKPPKTLTAIEAATKISKVLEQLAPAERKRVLAFVNDGGHSNE